MFCQSVPTFLAKKTFFVGQGLVKGMHFSDLGLKRGVGQVFVKGEAKLHVGRGLVKNVKIEGFFWICWSSVGQGRRWSSAGHENNC